jgi:hypothetical protein
MAEELSIWEKNIDQDGEHASFHEVHPEACCEHCGTAHCGRRLGSFEIEEDEVWYEPCFCTCEEAVARRDRLDKSDDWDLPLPDDEHLSGPAAHGLGEVIEEEAEESPEE